MVDAKQCPRHMLGKSACRTGFGKESFGQPLSEESYAWLKQAAAGENICRRHAFSELSDKNCPDERARQFALDALITEKEKDLRMLLIMYLASQRDVRVIQHVIKDIEDAAKEIYLNKNALKTGGYYINHLLFVVRKFIEKDCSAVHALGVLYKSVADEEEVALNEQIRKLFLDLYEKYHKTLPPRINVYK
ncbi:MAG: hypothetical protein QXS93_02155 [Candidatus Micrarchaeia archaeon]